MALPPELADGQLDAAVPNGADTPSGSEGAEAASGVDGAQEAGEVAAPAPQGDVDSAEPAPAEAVPAEGPDQTSHAPDAADAQLEPDAVDEAAAVAIQAVVRGRAGRKRAQGIAQVAAAVRIQAVMRGRLGRREVKQRVADEAAAVTIQAVVRGRAGRREAKQRVADEAAAVTIQAVVRGRAGRRRVRDLRGPSDTEEAAAEGEAEAVEVEVEVLDDGSASSVEPAPGTRGGPVLAFAAAAPTVVPAPVPARPTSVAVEEEDAGGEEEEEDAPSPTNDGRAVLALVRAARGTDPGRSPYAGERIGVETGPYGEGHFPLPGDGSGRRSWSSGRERGDSNSPPRDGRGGKDGRPLPRGPRSGPLPTDEEVISSVLAEAVAERAGRAGRRGDSELSRAAATILATGEGAEAVRRRGRGEAARERAQAAAVEAELLGADARPAARTLPARPRGAEEEGDGAPLQPLSTVLRRFERATHMLFSAFAHVHKARPSAGPSAGTFADLATHSRLMSKGEWLRACRFLGLLGAEGGSAAMLGRGPGAWGSTGTAAAPYPGPLPASTLSATVPVVFSRAVAEGVFDAVTRGGGGGGRRGRESDTAAALRGAADSLGVSPTPSRPSASLDEPAFVSALARTAVAAIVQHPVLGAMYVSDGDKVAAVWGRCGLGNVEELGRRLRAEGGNGVSTTRLPMQQMLAASSGLAGAAEAEARRAALIATLRARPPRGGGEEGAPSPTAAGVQARSPIYAGPLHVSAFTATSPPREGADGGVGAFVSSVYRTYSSPYSPSSSSHVAPLASPSGPQQALAPSFARSIVTMLSASDGGRLEGVYASLPPLTAAVTGVSGTGSLTVRPAGHGALSIASSTSPSRHLAPLATSFPTLGPRELHPLDLADAAEAEEAALAREIEALSLSLPRGAQLRGGGGGAGGEGAAKAPPQQPFSSPSLKRSGQGGRTGITVTPGSTASPKRVRR